MPPGKNTLLDPVTYNRFIASLVLHDVVLARTEAMAHVPSIQPGETGIRAEFNVRDDECKSEPNICQVLANLRVELVRIEDEEIIGFVDVSFRLIYGSEESLTPAIRERFKAVNVPINAWPYLREYVQQTMTRFGWPPFVLPPYSPLPPSSGPTQEEGNMESAAKQISKNTTKRKVKAKKE